MIARRALLRSAVTAPFIIPARKALALMPLHGGGATCGAPPAPALAVGYCTQAFYDGFDSINTIDVNNTGGLGFKWWTRSTWPNFPATTTPSSMISVASSAVTLHNSANVYGIGLSSAFWNGGGGYNGFAVDASKGFYAECRMSYDPNVSSGSGAVTWPAFWAMPVEWSANGTRPYVEHDFFEALPGDGNPWHVNPAFTTHEWAAGDSQNNNARPSFNINFNDTAYHTVGERVIPTTANGGTGLIQSYYDGVHRSECDRSYFAASPETPGMTAANPSGCLFEGQSMHFYLIISGGSVNPGGTDWPVSYDYVGVWTP